MWKFLKGLLITFGVLFILLIVGTVVAVRMAANYWSWEEASLPDRMVLRAAITQDLDETATGFRVAGLFDGPSLKQKTSLWPRGISA